MTDPMRGHYASNPLDDFETVHAPAVDAIDLLTKKRIAERLATLTADRRPINVQITQHFNFDRLRINVAHLVSPQVVRWKK